MNEKSSHSGSELGAVRYTEDQKIFTEGEEGDAAYLIRSGRVQIRKGIDGRTPIVLAELGEGELLGEMALFDNRPRMASAIALQDVELIKMTRKDFLSRLSALDPVLKSMVITMIARTRQMTDEFILAKQEGHWRGRKR